MGPLPHRGSYKRSHGQQLRKVQVLLGRFHRGQVFHSFLCAGAFLFTVRTFFASAKGHSLFPNPPLFSFFFTRLVSIYTYREAQTPYSLLSLPLSISECTHTHTHIHYMIVTMLKESSPQISPFYTPASPNLTLCSSLSGLVLQHLEIHCLATVSGHSAAVSFVASAGEFLYTASLGNEICVWEQADLKPCNRFSAGSADNMCSVKALLVVGDTVFGAHQDHKIRAWRCKSSSSADATPTHRLVATLPSRADCFLKSLSQKNYVQVRRHHKSLWIEHTDTISALALGKTQEVFYSASWDKTVKVWRLSDLRCVESIQAHDDAVNALAICDKGGFLYTGSADGKVKVWRKDGGAKKHTLITTMEGGHEKGASVNALALREGGDVLFSGGSDGGVAVWGRRKGKEHVSVLLSTVAACHALPILSLCIIEQEEGALLLSGSADKTVRVWRISSSDGYLAYAGVLRGHHGPVNSICVAPNHEQQQMIVGGGCLVYTGSADKSIKAWWLSSS